MGQPFPLSSATIRKSEDGPAPRAGRRWPAVVQVAIVLVGAGLMTIAPPATGRMLLVPLNGGGRDGLARIATGAGAALVDAGPFHGSLIVSGERSALFGAMMQGHMLVLRAAQGGCGSEGRGI